MINIQNLVKRYARSNRVILNGINLEIKKGEFFGLLGPNGSGKTTLISILCGLIDATEGEITIADHQIPKNLNDIKSLINLVPQETALYPTLTLSENLLFFAHMYELSKEQLERQIEKYLNLSGLENYYHQLISTFSGGMMRRANLIVSLLNEPEILFLDEPASHVDPQSRHVIFDILTMLNKNGVTLIYTTHYLEEAEKLCSRVAILDNGNIICDDSPSHLIANTPGSHNLSDVFFKLTGKELRDIPL